MDSVVDRILKICDHLGMSVSSFASSIGVNQVTLNNYKLGKRKPSLELIEKITKKYPQVSAEWLIRGIGQMMCPGIASDKEVFGDNPNDNTSPEESDLAENIKDERIKLLEEKIAFLEEQVDFYKNKA